MSGNLAQMARDAGKAVLNTLTDVDYVTIVTFSSQASSYSTTLVQATASNVVAMGNWIDNNVGASGSTNFRAAFAKTWSVLAASSASTSNSNCNRVVLFLTDGEPNNWEEADYEAVKANSVAHGNAKVLTYHLHPLTIVL
jgi:Mg-chelatase subunit ChlD